ncbi:WYL domain-containing protein [Paenibacillus lactis]
MRRYIGKIIEIIYVDRKGQITQSKIRLQGIRNKLIRATCLKTNQPRVFRMENILFWGPAKGAGMNAS